MIEIYVWIDPNMVFREYECFAGEIVFDPNNYEPTSMGHGHGVYAYGREPNYMIVVPTQRDYKGFGAGSGIQDD